MQGLNPQTCAALFTKFQDAQVLITAKQCAEWTVASIFPDTSSNDNQTRKQLKRDFQSHGAMLVNNLASKVAQALFPQNSSFFEIGQTDAMEQMAQELGADSKAAASLFAGIEARASARVFLNAGYAALERAIKLLIVSGNALAYRDPETRKFHTYSVRDYAIRRDGAGNVLLIVLKERIAVADLPADFAASVNLSERNLYDDVDLYTKIERVLISQPSGPPRTVYKVSQECQDRPIGKPSLYPEYLCPYIPLTWNLIAGEHYGRSYVEDYAGSFAKLSALSESSLLYEVEMMRLINIIDPSAGIDLDDVANAEVGEFVAGKSGVTGNGVVAHEGGNAQKLSAVLSDIQNILQQLSIAFMYTGNTRDAERVTAEEIRANISEANQTLGGIYANISEVLHIHLAHLLVIEEEPALLPLLNTQGITLDVAVGLSSLNREANVQKLQYLANALSTVLPVLSQSSQRFNPDLIIDQLCQGYGIDREAISYTEGQLKQLQQQQEASAQQSAAQAQAQAAQATQGAQVDPQVANLNSQQLGLT